MNSFIPWTGGKKNLREAAVLRFPLKYERYIEVFGGGGWVLFHKPQTSFEVLNDVNSNLTNLYRCVREQPEELKKQLEYVVNSREDFERIASLHKNGLLPQYGDCDRAVKFYQLIRGSYANNLRCFSAKPHSYWSDFPLIDMAAERLQRVIIENKDFAGRVRIWCRA